MKLKFIITLFVSSFLLTLTSCNKHPYQSVPQNNWTQEDKDLVIKNVHEWLDTSPIPELSHNTDEIAQRSLNECIIDYPDIEDFKKHDMANAAESYAMAKIVGEYIKH